MIDLQLESILQMARPLVGRFHDETDGQLQELIKRAEEENDPDIGLDIAELLARNGNIRRWMNEQTQLQDGQERLVIGVEPLGGRRGSVPASRKWKCTQEGCTQSLPVIQEDEDAPSCRVHGCAMARNDGKG